MYYVNKDDPLGDKPDNPKNDAQYKNWEKGVESYYKNKSKDYIFDEKPRACEAKDFEVIIPQPSKAKVLTDYISRRARC